MILKSFDINKINLNIHHLILFYGKNEGLKNESLYNLNKDKINPFHNLSFIKCLLLCFFILAS